MADNDEAFDPDKLVPEIIGCLLHPSVRAVVRRHSGEQAGFESVLYGLCGACVRSLRRSRKYQDYIDNEIKSRLQKLNNKMEGQVDGSQNGQT